MLKREWHIDTVLLGRSLPLCHQFHWSHPFLTIKIAGLFLSAFKIADLSLQVTGSVTGHNLLAVKICDLSLSLGHQDRKSLPLRHQILPWEATCGQGVTWNTTDGRRQLRMAWARCRKLWMAKDDVRGHENRGDLGVHRLSGMDVERHRRPPRSRARCGWGW